MSTTTQILFNSPALHALKRDQLVKLCKIHSIKASGKNVDLIDRLKHHAQTLPRDSPLSIASRSEDPGADQQGDDTAVNNEQSTQENEAEEVQGSGWKFQMPRPSEQWEVVMESIQELDENSSQGTLSSTRTLGSTGEFGTGSSKSTTVTSSIKALANSLGLKRIASTSANSTRGNNTFTSSMSSTSSSKLLKSFPPPPPTVDELTHHSIPYASLPPTDSTALPQTDHYTFDPNDRPATLDPSYNCSFNSEKPHAPFNFSSEPAPLPGHTLRPGIPAPSDARLSLGLGPSTPTSNKSGPTTTIRLISNPIFMEIDRSNDPATPQLKPFETTFDLVLGSPAGAPRAGVWPREEEDGEKQRMYPALPTDTLPASGDGDVDMPGALSCTPPRTPTPASTLAPPPAPFIFGSPLPQHNLSNTQFRSAAASVLEEMNRRLREDGVDGVEMDLLVQRRGGGGDRERAVKPLPGGKEGFGLREKFERAHEEEFRKMESIAGGMERSGSNNEQGDVPRVGKKRKSSALGRDGGGPRRPSGMGVKSVTGMRVISNGRRKNLKAAIPGAFGDEGLEDSEVEEEARGGKRARVNNDGRGDAKNEVKEKEDVDEEKKRKEREAIRKKLEMNKARRRSSMGVAGKGRVSLGGKSVLNKPKPSRFGFLSSAKSLVQNVWNRGKAPATATSSSIPVSKPPTQKHPPFQPVKKVSIAPTLAPATGRPSTSVPGAKPNRAPSVRLNKDKEKDKGGFASTTSTSRARSPIPSFMAAPSVSTTTTSRRVASSIGTNSRVGSRNSSITGLAPSSSIGTRSSVATRSNAGSGFGYGSRVSSLGTRGSVDRGGDAGSAGSKKAAATERKRVLSSSRLLAPTASSLAKGGASMRTSVSMGLPAVVEDHPIAGSHTLPTTSKSVPSTLEQITNRPAAVGRLVPPNSPGPGDIFSKPLTLPGSSSSIPTPRNTPSPFAVAGTALADSSLLEAKKFSVPTSAAIVPKQKVLPGRKPRISRSRVIAKLASQRAASGNGSRSGVASNPASSGGGRARSSLGVGVQRQSYGGGKAGGRASGDVMMSAKKRARQSEYARRRSRAAGGSSVGVGGASVND